MDRRRFFTDKNILTESFSARSNRYLLEDAFEQLNSLYEEDEEVKEQPKEETSSKDTKAEKSPEKESNAAEAKAIINKLKDVDYERFVTILNSDGKSKAFLNYLQQHYKLGDNAIKTVKQSGANETTIACSSLVPTQQNISIDKSLGMIKEGGWSVNIINKPESAFRDPTVTYAGKYIIDGHHRWSKAYALNGGDSVITILDFPAIDGVSWEDMLKATQLAIVAKNPEVGLVNEVPDDNMLGNSGAEEAANYYKENACDEVVTAMKEKGRGDTAEAQAETIKKHVLKMKETSSPVAGAAPRSVMPQTDKAPGSTDLLKTAVIDLTEEKARKRAYSRARRSRK